MTIQTDRLLLSLRSSADVLRWLESLAPELRKEVSPTWVQQIQDAEEASAWTHGFDIIHADTSNSVGSIAFKGEPDEHGVVEIAYEVHDDHRRQGYATEAVRALVQWTLNTGIVSLVRAHTLVDGDASMRVLENCGFQRVGEVMDPEDGLVIRWEFAA